MSGPILGSRPCIAVSLSAVNGAMSKNSSPKLNVPACCSALSRITSILLCPDSRTPAPISSNRVLACGSLPEMNCPAVAPPVVLKLPLLPNLEMSPNAEDRFSASILLIAASSVIGSKALPVNTSPI